MQEFNLGDHMKGLSLEQQLAVIDQRNMAQKLIEQKNYEGLVNMFTMQSCLLYRTKNFALEQMRKGL